MDLKLNPHHWSIELWSLIERGANAAVSNHKFTNQRYKFKSTFWSECLQKNKLKIFRVLFLKLNLNNTARCRGNTNTHRSLFAREWWGYWNSFESKKPASNDRNWKRRCNAQVKRRERERGRERAAVFSTLKRTFRLHTALWRTKFEFQIPTLWSARQREKGAWFMVVAMKLLPTSHLQQSKPPSGCCDWCVHLTNRIYRSNLVRCFGGRIFHSARHLFVKQYKSK